VVGIFLENIDKVDLLMDSSGAPPFRTFSSPCSALGGSFDFFDQIRDCTRASNTNKPIDRVRQGPDGSASTQPGEERGCYAICLVCSFAFYMPEHPLTPI
jgi:hypothetical protein